MSGSKASEKRGGYSGSKMKGPRGRAEVAGCGRHAQAVVEQHAAEVISGRAAVECAQCKGAALRRLILERAFRGELVPQDPSDEPAEALLDRIRADRAAAPTPRRRTRT